MTDWKKELKWLLAACFVTAFIYYGIVPTIFEDSVLNIHDTYFVFDFTSLLFPIIVIAFYFVYFFRIVWERFNGVVGNSVFLIFNTLIIIGLLFFAVTLSSMNKETVYPPLSAFGETAIAKASQGILTAASVLYGAAIVFSLFEVFVIYKIYRKIKPAKKTI